VQLCEVVTVGCSIVELVTAGCCT